MNTMVTVDGLSKQFGHLHAVNGVSFTLHRGEVLGFLGPNGSGKSTTMKMVTGFLNPSSGTVAVCGLDVQRHRIQAQRHLGYLPEGAPAYADMTPAAYLEFIANVRQLAGAVREAAIRRVTAHTHIDRVMHQPIETLSKGYKRRVGVAQALLHDPPVLVLDEPTDGLDPNQKHEVRRLIREMAPHKAIIISTHILEEVEAVCTRALIISEGRIVADGTPNALIQHSRYHNAVSLLVSTSQSATIQSRLHAMDNVSSVEARVIDDCQTQLLAVADPERDAVSEIARIAREEAWEVEQIHRQRGQLDDVFRTLTAPPDAHSALPTEESSNAQPSPIATGSFTIRDAWTIFRREFFGYFSTPVAYVFLVIFLAALGALTFFVGHFFDQGQATLDGFFQFHPWLYLFLVPAISMRLWAEERRSGSIELLLSLPVTSLSAVLGKYFAAWAVAGIGLMLTTPIWASVNYLGRADNGVIAAGYLGSFLMAGSYLAIGTFVSAMTRNQVVAFIIAATVSFLFTASGLGVVLEFFSGWAPRSLLDAVAHFSFLEHFRDLARGVVDLRDVVFFASTIVFFLFANVVTVEYKKNG